MELGPQEQDKTLSLRTFFARTSSNDNNMASTNDVDMAAPDGQDIPSSSNDGTETSPRPPTVEPTVNVDDSQPIATTERSGSTNSVETAQPSQVQVEMTDAGSSQDRTSEEFQQSTSQSRDSQQPVASRQSSVREATPSGQKRHAAVELQKEPAKKAKTNVEDSTVEEETVESVKAKLEALREKANGRLAKQKDTIQEQRVDIQSLEEDVTQLQKKLRISDKRGDKLLVEVIALKREKEIEESNKKAKAAEIKTSYAQLEEELRDHFQKKYAKDLETKTAAKENNWSAKFELKKTKIEGLQKDIRELKASHKDEVSNLKESHREEVRKLKHEIVEANKGGGAKTREKLKEAERELKDLDNICNRLESDKAHALGEIVRQEMKVKAAVTEKENLQRSYNNHWNDIRDWEQKYGNLEAQYETKLGDYQKMQQRYQADLDQLEKNKVKEIKHERQKAALYHQNQQHSQQIAVHHQRNSFPLRMANEKLVKENQSLKKQLDGNGVKDDKTAEIETLKLKLKEAEAAKAKLNIYEQFAEPGPELKQRLERCGGLDKIIKPNNAPA